MQNESIAAGADERHEFQEIQSSQANYKWEVNNHARLLPISPRL